MSKKLRWIGRNRERRDSGYSWIICNRQIVVTALLFLWKNQRWNVTRLFIFVSFLDSRMVFYHLMTLFPMAILSHMGLVRLTYTVLTSGDWKEC